MPDLERAAALYESAGDVRGLSRCHSWLSLTAYQFTHREAMIRHGDLALAAARRAGDPELELIARRFEVWTAAFADRIGLAREFARGFLRIGNLHEAVWMLGVTAYATLADGDARAAAELLAEALPPATQLGNQMALRGMLENRGLAQLFQGSREEAAESFRAALNLSRDAAFTALAQESLLGLASIAALEGAFERAAMLVGAAEAYWQRLYEQSNRAISERMHDEFLTPARESAGEEAWHRDYDAGASLSLDETVEPALSAPAR